MFGSTCKTLTLAAALSLLTVSGTALADNHFAQLKGKWLSFDDEGYRFGAVTHGDAIGEPQSLNDDKRTWILDIEMQDRAGVKGTWGSDTKRELILGVVRADNKTIVFADEDSYLTGVLLSETEMELCAQEAGEAIIAKCHRLKRQ